MSCVEPEMKFYNPTPHPTRSTQYAPGESRPTARAYFTAEPAADVGLRPGVAATAASAAASSIAICVQEDRDHWVNSPRSRVRERSSS